MKSVLVTLCLLAGVFWWACAIDRPLATTQLASQRVEPSDDWRRTAEGWERRSLWPQKDAAAVPAAATVAQLHPLLLASLQVLICCGALLWFDPVHRRIDR